MVEVEAAEGRWLRLRGPVVEAERAGAVFAVNTFPHCSPSLSLFTIPLQNIIQPQYSCWGTGVIDCLVVPVTRISSHYYCWNLLNQLVIDRMFAKCFAYVNFGLTFLCIKSPN